MRMRDDREPTCVTYVWPKQPEPRKIKEVKLPWRQ